MYLFCEVSTQVLSIFFFKLCCLSLLLGYRSLYILDISFYQISTLWISSCHSMTWKKVKVAQSCPTACNPMDYTDRGILQVRVGSCCLLQGIFPTPGSNSCLLRCKLVLYQLSHQGSPRMLEWAAHPFSTRSSQPRNWTGVNCTVGRFFTNWTMTYLFIFLMAIFWWTQFYFWSNSFSHFKKFLCFLCPF